MALSLLIIVHELGNVHMPLFRKNRLFKEKHYCLIYNTKDDTIARYMVTQLHELYIIFEVTRVIKAWMLKFRRATSRNE